MIGWDILPRFISAGIFRDVRLAVRKPERIRDWFCAQTAIDDFVRAEKPDGTFLKEKRVYSPRINLPESKDAPVTTCVFAKRELAGADAVRFVVRPANCWGICGRSLQVKG